MACGIQSNIRSNLNSISSFWINPNNFAEIDRNASLFPWNEKLHSEQLQEPTCLVSRLSTYVGMDVYRNIVDYAIEGSTRASHLKSSYVVHEELQNFHGEQNNNCFSTPRQTCSAIRFTILYFHIQAVLSLTSITSRNEVYPRVTINIATLNEERNISACLESILAQD